jgi:geranylgeranyl pyrophosphate synthase
VKTPEVLREEHPESGGFELCSGESLSRWTERVTAELRQAVDTLCGPESRLARLIMSLVSREPSQVHRLLSLMVLAALTGDPEPALPVCLVSRLWWAGVDALDDLVDGQAGRDPALSPQQVMVGATACITLPHEVPRLWPVPGLVRLDWEREITRASAAAAEGQLAEQLTEPEEPSWARAMASYRDKNGAAYARDAVMAARLATDDPAVLRGWRAFGSLFGVMRQLRNDSEVPSAADDEDLANGVFTLELAHALETAAPDRRASLRALSGQARHDTAARGRLRRALAEPDLARAYGTKIQSMGNRARLLLDELAAPSPQRVLLHHLVGMTAATPLTPAIPAEPGPPRTLSPRPKTLPGIAPG